MAISLKSTFEVIALNQVMIGVFTFFSFNFDVSEQICVGFLLTIDPIRLLNNIRQKRIQLAAHAFTLRCILYCRFMLNKIERKIV